VKPTLHPETKLSLKFDRGPDGAIRHRLELTQPQTGELEGLVAKTTLELFNGEVCTRSACLEAVGDPFSRTASARVRRELRMNSAQQIAETLLPNLPQMNGVPDFTVEAAIEWMEAFSRKRKRPGSAGTDLLIYAEVARRRVEAQDWADEQLASGRGRRSAIDYMVERWPAPVYERGSSADFATAKAAHAKVNRAIQKGMLERGDDGKWTLTPDALVLLQQGGDQ
jgi:hypothetical protein